MTLRLRILAMGLFSLAAFSSVARATSNPIVRFNTNLGNIDVILYADRTPLTVANFQAYMNSGAYTNNIIHRSVLDPNVIQGGVIDIPSTGLTNITPLAAVTGEPGVSNTCGTIAMALSTGPNSGTSSWFFNTTDNSAILDGAADGGPFTVFGVVANSASLAVMQEIASVPVPNPSPFALSQVSYIDSYIASLFANIPLINYTSGAVRVNNLVIVNSVTTLVHPSFFNGEALLPNTNFNPATQLPNSDLYYLQLPNSTVFGYYNDNSFPIIYHYNLGYEYVYDAGGGGVYFFDYHSGHFWYTNPASYPFFYDFTLNTYLYYYAGNGNPRYFYNYATQKVITE